MQCMKCGRDLDAGEVFCWECREVMDKYPVKPGTVVQLPQRRPEQFAVKKQPVRRKSISPEEQVVLLRRISRRLAIGLILAVLFAGAAGYVAVTQFLENQSKQALGQNYSVMETEETVSETFGPEDADIAG